MAYNKYYVYKEQVSRDNGLTWSYTGNETPSGSPIATYDTLAECEGGYEPAPTGIKYRATYIGGEVYNLSCFGEHGTLTSGNTYHSGYFSSAVTTAQIGDCVTAIGTSAFAGFESLSRLNSIIDGVGIIPSGVTSIDDGAFACCRSLTAITIPSGVTSIGEVAFNDCYNLTSINIPSGVTSIANYTFSSCYNLTGITIPSGVTTIGISAFEGCSSLASITCLATTPPTLGRDVFDNTNNCPIYVPSGSVSAYKSASGWSTYASRIQPIP